MLDVDWRKEQFNMKNTCTPDTLGGSLEAVVTNFKRRLVVVRVATLTPTRTLTVALTPIRTRRRDPCWMLWLVKCGRRGRSSLENHPYNVLV